LRVLLIGPKLKHRCGHERPLAAEYHKHYDAVAQQWRVQLVIRGTPGFEAVGSGSLRTELVVDAMYREWLAQQ
jgi:hypothetical protein